jgi:DNA topoisomerase IA
MKVIIAEKPSVGREIAKVFGATTKKDGYIEGKGYTFTWAFGHLLQVGRPARVWLLRLERAEPAHASPKIQAIYPQGKNKGRHGR